MHRTCLLLTQSGHWLSFARPLPSAWLCGYDALSRPSEGGNETARVHWFTDKAEIALEYPDKLYVGTFESSSRFEAHLDATGIALILRATRGL